MTITKRNVRLRFRHASGPVRHWWCGARVKAALILVILGMLRITKDRPWWDEHVDFVSIQALRAGALPGSDGRVTEMASRGARAVAAAEPEGCSKFAS